MNLRRVRRKTIAASARGADGGRVEHLTAPRFAMRCGSWFIRASIASEIREFDALERQQHVHYLAAVPRLLHVGDLAVAAIGDAGLRDLA
jgi:hypothetical protein